MSRRQVWVLAAAGVLAAVLIAIAAAGEGGRGSSLSRGAEGWLAARRYLEARGAEVRLLDATPDPDPVDGSEGVLVEVFPWSAIDLDDRRASALSRWLAGGGDLVIAYSGGFDPREDRVLETLGIDLTAVREPPPLSPLAWRRDARLSWRLAPAGGEVEEPAIELPAPRWVPRWPAGAEVLYRSAKGDPLVFVARRAGPRSAGRLVVLPAAVLANASLAEAGNADLLESLLATLGPRWAFDESVHGLVAAAGGAPAGRRAGRAMDLLSAHLALLYLLAVVSLGRRFGPAWRAPEVATGSTASFLLRLGGLHHRLGHHREAALRLVERWRELHPRQPVPEAVARGAEQADAEGLVALARALARGESRRS